MSSPLSNMVISWVLVMDDQKWKEVSSIQGDSGGPFTVADSQTGVHTLVGAVSFGLGCARVSNIQPYSLHCNVQCLFLATDQLVTYSKSCIL